MNLRSYLKPWILITVGILMNIISAVVTHYFISQNNVSIQAIEQKITAIESNIESQWKAKTEMERKNEFTLLLLNNMDNQPLKPAIQSFLQQHLNALKQQYLSTEQQSISAQLSILSSIEITQLAQQKVIDDINDDYFKKLELETSKSPLQKHNAALYSLAIFMQLIGLILVLSRDLAQR